MAAIAVIAVIGVLGVLGGIWWLSNWSDPPAETPPARNDVRAVYKSLPVEQENSKAITARDGGSLELPGGIRVEFPAGALASDRTIRVARLKPVGPGEPSVIVDVDAGEEELKHEATVTIAVPRDERTAGIPKGQEKFLALHIHGNERRVIGYAYDAAADKVTVKTKRFSYIHLIVMGAAVLTEALREEIRVAGEDGILLPVPFYPQGDAKWCWAACTQMMRKHYGKESEIWDIARALDAPLEQGFSGVDVLSRVMTTLVEGADLNVDASLLGYYNVTHLTEEIARQIQVGRPVWVALPAIQHVVVVVGYDQYGLYIHDPSGTLLEALHKIFPSTKPSGELDLQLCNVHLSWTDWRAIFTPDEDFLSKVGTAVQPAGHIMVVTGAKPVKSNTLTLTVHHNGIEFRHPKHSGSDADGGNYANLFQWDGTIGHGHRFTGVQRLIQGFPFTDPTNSDRLVKFTVTLNNSGLEPVRDVRVRLFLNKKEFRSKDGIEVPRKTTNFAVELMDSGPHDFSTDTLPPGDYTFNVAVEVGGVVKDSAEIPFRMGPSRPEGLKAESSADEVLLSWEPCPEPDVHYVIWRDRDFIGTTRDSSYEADGDGAEHTWKIETVYAGPGLDILPGFSESRVVDTNWKENWLSSYLSEPVKAAAEKKKGPEPTKPVATTAGGHRLAEIEVTRRYFVYYYGDKHYKLIQGPGKLGPEVKSFELGFTRELGPNIFGKKEMKGILTVNAPAAVEAGAKTIAVSATAKMDWEYKLSPDDSLPVSEQVAEVVTLRLAPDKPPVFAELKVGPSNPLKSGKYGISAQDSQTITLSESYYGDDNVRRFQVIMASGENEMYVTFIYRR